MRPDTEHWSFYSSPYMRSGIPGSPLHPPGPRKFVQIRVDFASTTVAEGGKIDYLEFKASVPPLVRRLVGEIHPTETEVGKATQFTYYISPTIRSTDSSFDGGGGRDAFRGGVGRFATPSRHQSAGFLVDYPRRRSGV